LSDIVLHRRGHEISTRQSFTACFGSDAFFGETFFRSISDPMFFEVLRNFHSQCFGSDAFCSVAEP
jgi:hypothetical protein